MFWSSHSTKSPRFAMLAHRGKGCVACILLAICVYVGVHAIAESFHVPSGSMAPALRGHHRVCVCPRCGHENAIGRADADVTDAAETRYYRKTFCQNCGLFPLPMTTAHSMAGDRIVVNKTAFLARSPNRWEMVVFRLLGVFFVKRVLGLPGEEVQLEEGDLYVESKLMRKTLAEARAMRVLVFDHDHAPQPGGWTERWECDKSAPSPDASEGPDRLSVDGLLTPHTLTYRHFSLDARKCEPIRDEYAYNAGVHADSVCVHDFLVDTEVLATAGRGSLSLRLCDGQDWIEMLLPVGAGAEVEAFAWPIEHPEQMRQLGAASVASALQLGQRYRVELAFVDRRVSLAVDGRLWLSVDLPTATKRAGVERPFQAQAEGVHVEFERFRLYRDVHYAQQGTNGVQGKSVLLNGNQYFMLGDNSANSEDSRFWANEGRVEHSSLVGSVFLVRR